MMSTATEFTVTLEDRPGALADLTGVLGEAKINIHAIQGMPRDGEGLVQFLTTDPDGTHRALDSAGIAYTTQDVLLVGLTHKPGSLAQAARALSDAGINIEGIYVTMNQLVVFAVDDLPSAQKVVDQLGRV